MQDPRLQCPLQLPQRSRPNTTPSGPATVSRLAGVMCLESILGGFPPSPAQVQWWQSAVTRPRCVCQWVSKKSDGRSMATVTHTARSPGLPYPALPLHLSWLPRRPDYLVTLEAAPQPTRPTHSLPSSLPRSALLPSLHHHNSHPRQHSHHNTGVSTTPTALPFLLCKPCGNGSK